MARPLDYPRSPTTSPNIQGNHLSGRIRRYWANPHASHSHGQCHCLVSHCRQARMNVFTRTDCRSRCDFCYNGGGCSVRCGIEPSLCGRKPGHWGATSRADEISTGGGDNRFDRAGRVATGGGLAPAERLCWRSAYGARPTRQSAANMRR